MNADEKARKICVPLYRDIHSDLGGTISMGDIAAIIGQRMHDAVIEMHNWTLGNAKSMECRCWCGSECGCPCHDTRKPLAGREPGIAPLRMVL